MKDHSNRIEGVPSAVQDHLLAICRCPVIDQTLNGDATPCEPIINFQRERSTSPIQVPTPWLGHLEVAPILFIGANPNIGFIEAYPRWPADDDSELVDAFQFAYDSPHQWIKDGTKQLHADGEHSVAIRFWSQVKGRARELLMREPVPGVDYAITEIVRCRSQNEVGVESARTTCTSMWLAETIRLSPAMVIVLLGNNAAWGFAQSFACPADGVFKATIAGQDRTVACLPHPNARKKRKFESVYPDELPGLRALLHPGLMIPTSDVRATSSGLKGHNSEGDEQVN